MTYNEILANRCSSKRNMDLFDQNMDWAHHIVTKILASSATLKIIVAGAFYKHSKMGGRGFIVCDHNVEVVVSDGVGKLDHIIDPIQAETIAVLHGLNFVMNLNTDSDNLEQL